MTYQTEFPSTEHPPADVVAWLETNGFQDQSWHNDVMPNWSKGAVCVWATSKAAVDGEECAAQFSISRMTDDDQHAEDDTQRIFNDWDSCRLEIEAILENGWAAV